VSDDGRLHYYDSKIVSVHDGDTVRLDLDMGFHLWVLNRQCRFLGVWAPELGTLKAPSPEGEAATQHLMKLLGRERFSATRTRTPGFGILGDYLALPGMEPEVIVQTMADKSNELDKYGRVLGSLWLADGTTVNDRMAQYLTVEGL
jgi:endonuclease YncB( thermonuclease family)